MNRIDETFAALKAAGKKALIPFITAGDPDMETTEKLVCALFQSGADLVELGIPFSDPIAEGPTIQAASVRSLNAGTTLAGVFDMVKRLRQEQNVSQPILFMMYGNTIFRYGTDRFFAQCREVGVDGVIVPDVPYEEREEFLPCAQEHGVRYISLVTPASQGRIQEIASQAEGFLYCVSSVGVTGTRSEFTTNFDSFFGEICKSCPIPFCVGFGISSPEQAKEMASYCDGVIVGSAVVKLVGQDGRSCVPAVEEFVKSLREVL